MKLFIDDLRRPPTGEYVLVRDVADAVFWVSANGCPDEISFDYCLACGKTVMPFVEWLIEKDKELKGQFFPKNFTYQTHSSSEFGCAEIHRVLGGYLRLKSKPPVAL
ncbi:MAG: hypothetical protein IJC30_02555 [Alphaproteobacteria bacterium]|nr:hypothetical protein [Alphaproteobacteria bacterium]